MKGEIRVRKGRALIIFFLIISLVLSGCNNAKEMAKEKENNFEIKSALKIVNNYIGYLQKDDYTNAKKLYTKELSSKSKKVEDGELKIKGFTINNVNEIGRSALVELKVARCSEKYAQAFLDNLAIKVTKEGSEYKISDIKYSPEKEGFIESGKVRQRNKTNVKTDLILEKGSIPTYFFPKVDAGNIHKVLVSKEEFGRLQFNYNADKIAISTKGKMPFIGIIIIDDSLAVQGPSSGAGSTPPSGGTTGGQSSSGMKEIPIGKEIISLDVLKDKNIDFLVFSQDDEFVLCQYSDSNNGKFIRVYNTGEGSLIPVNLESIFPVDKVNILFNGFDKETLNFQVVKRNEKDNVDGNIIGNWSLDLKEFKLTKI